MNDDEVSTYRGQTLEENEKFDDPKSDDEDRNYTLDRNIVADVHFVGKILLRLGSLYREDLLNQNTSNITELKKRKAEWLDICEQFVDASEKIVPKRKDLLPLISAPKETKNDDIIGAVNDDAYDIPVRQSKFEARGNPSEKLKSEEEFMQEERKLQGYNE